MNVPAFLVREQHVMNFLKNSLWVRWVFLNAVGALVGMGVVAALMPVLIDRLLDTVTLRGSGAFVIFLTLTLFAGALVGVVIGFAQSLVLHQVDSSIERWRWSLVTALASLAVWAFAFLPDIIASTLPGASQTSERERLLGFISPLAGLLLGAIVGAMQWWVPRRRHVLTAFWIVVCALAGAVATPSIIAAATYAESQSSSQIFWVIAVLTALLTALTSSVMTGATLLSMVARKKQLPELHFVSYCIEQIHVRGGKS
jgi:hypothetical protein